MNLSRAPARFYTTPRDLTCATDWIVLVDPLLTRLVDPSPLGIASTGLRYDVCRVSHKAAFRSQWPEGGYRADRSRTAKAARRRDFSGRSQYDGEGRGDWCRGYRPCIGV
jgi:hypothetical protein